MKTKSKNINVSFSVNPENYIRFLKFFDDTLIDRSKLIEKLITKYLEKNK